jgi:HSP20 family protein
MTTALSTRASRALQPWFDRDLLASLQEEMDDLLSRFRADWNGGWALMAASPPIDLSETDDSLQIRMDAPGMKADDIDIQVSGNTIRISGERKDEKEEKGKTYLRRERRSGSFARTLTLPVAVKEDKVGAESKDGLLTITLPKIQAAKTLKVKIVAK